MSLLLVFLPLLGFLSVAFAGRFLGSKGSTYVTTCLSGIAFLLSVTTLINFISSTTVLTYVLANWIQSGFFNVNWAFTFDALTCVMLVVVTSVSFLVHLYSMEYMEGDPACSKVFFLSISFYVFHAYFGNCG